MSASYVNRGRHGVVFSLAVLISFFLTTHIASAHLFGASLTATSGPYTVDLGYDPADISTTIAERFDFLLWRGPADTGVPVEYDHVWVRLVHEKKTLLATGVRMQPFGPTTLLYLFKDSGSYTFDISFREADGDEIASAVFPLSVASEDAVPYLPIVAVFGFFAVTAATFVLWRRRR